jgi:hypothetical protein
MNDPDAVERWVAHAFAQVELPHGVEGWRVLVPARTPFSSVRRRLMAIGVTAAVATGLLIASIAGTLALTHSHPTPPASVHASSAPAATRSPLPTSQAAASACSRLETPTSLSGFKFSPPGAADPPISCARAIATFLCPPHYGNGPCYVLHGLPPTAELMRMSHVGPMGETRGSALPYVGPPFVPNNLLVWRVTWVPTVCTVDSTGVSGSDEPPYAIFLTQVPTRCRLSAGYLIDATTDNFVFFDSAQSDAG